MASKIQIKHEQPLTLKVTGATDDSGGSGIKSYSIYYTVVASGIQPDITDAKLLTTIDHLTSIPSTLFAYTTSGYPSSGETASGIVRDHYHSDHIFEYEWDGWESEMEHYFWTLAEDFSGNSSVLASGVHPGNPIYKEADYQAVYAKNIAPKVSVQNNVFLFTGKGTQVFKHDIVGNNIQLYVPAESELRIISPDRSEVIDKGILEGYHYFEHADDLLIFVRVSDWETPEGNLLVSGIVTSQAYLLTDNDIVIGQLEADYGANFPYLLNMFYGGKSLIPHTSDFMFGLEDDAHPQYLLIDGTRDMAGDLDMGTNNITNVGTVDGVIVSGLVSILWADSSYSLANDGVPSTNEYVQDDAATVKIRVSYAHQSIFKYMHLDCKAWVDVGENTGTITLTCNSVSDDIMVPNGLVGAQDLPSATISLSTCVPGNCYQVTVSLKAEQAGEVVRMRYPVIYLTV